MKTRTIFPPCSGAALRPSFGMLAVFCGLAAIAPVGLHAKDEPAVTVTRVGHGLYQTHAPALVHATHETIWEILTD